jgi:hypothetical protein
MITMFGNSPASVGLVENPLNRATKHATLVDQRFIISQRLPNQDAGYEQEISLSGECLKSDLIPAGSQTLARG